MPLIKFEIISGNALINISFSLAQSPDNNREISCIKMLNPLLEINHPKICIGKVITNDMNIRAIIRHLKPLLSCLLLLIAPMELVSSSIARGKSVMKKRE